VYVLRILSAQRPAIRYQGVDAEHLPLCDSSRERERITQTMVCARVRPRNEEDTMQFPTPYYDEWDDVYMLIRDIFMASAITCFLWAMHRIANGLMLGAQVGALQEYGDAYAPEEREVLIHKIKHTSMRY